MQKNCCDLAWQEIAHILWNPIFITEHVRSFPFNSRGNCGVDRLCGLVVRVLGYRSGGPGSIPGTTRKKCSGSGMWCTQPREYKLRSYLIEK
jgi:hypothetical protein